MLNQQAQAFVNRVAQANPLPFRELGVDALRANGPRLRRLAGPAQELPRMDSITVPGTPPVNVRRYSPVPHGTGQPTLVFAHGGGWVAGGIDDIDAPLSKLCDRSGWDIVSVDYRLSPEHPYPAASEDVCAALAWAAESASTLAVAGESAGGSLAVGAAAWWRDHGGPTPLELLIGIYPALGANLDLPSYETNSAYGFTRDDVEWFLEQYLPDGVDRDGAIPLESASFKGLPRTYVISAEYDVLIDEAKDFVARLRDEGVPVAHQIEEGTIHGFFGLGSIMDASETAVDLIAAQLRSIAAPVVQADDNRASTL